MFVYTGNQYARKPISSSCAAAWNWCCSLLAFTQNLCSADDEHTAALGLESSIKPGPVAWVAVVTCCVMIRKILAVGRIMSIHKTGFSRGVLAGVSLLAFSCFPVVAQTPAAQSGTEQKSRVPARVMDTVDDTDRTVLRGNVHPKARAEFDRGAVADAQPVTRIVLVLQRSAEQEAALRQLMEQQQSKNSPNYHAWLTPEQFGAQFGPADADGQAVTDWLTSHGFQNIKVTKGKTVVEFSGNAGLVRNAFGTEIHKFNVNGEEHFANVSDPQIPAALAPVVAGLRSLHNFHPKPQARQLGSFRRMESGEIR